MHIKEELCICFGFWKSVSKLRENWVKNDCLIELLKYNFSM